MQESRGLFDVVQQSGMLQQRDLDRFAQATSPMGVIETLEQGEIVDDSQWGAEASKEILVAEGVDPVLDTDTSITLGKCGRWHPDHADAAMRCRCGESGRIQDGTTSDDQCDRSPTDMLIVDGPGDRFKEDQPVLVDSPPGMTTGGPVGRMPGESLLPSIDRIDQIGSGFQQARIDHRAEPYLLLLFREDRLEDLIVIRKGIPGESEPVSPRNGEGPVHGFPEEFILQADAVIRGT